MLVRAVERGSGEHVAVGIGEVRQVRSDGAFELIDAVDDVTGAADGLILRETFGGERPLLRKDGRLPGAGDPGVVVGLVDGAHPGAHEGVGQSAELPTLAPVLAGLVGLDDQVGLLAGHEVALAVELRHPEVVQHILGGHVQAHLPCGGDHHHVGGRDPFLRVPVLEPPLMADDVDLECVVGAFGEVEDRLHGGHGQAGEEHDGDGRPDHLEDRAAVNLPGFGLPAVAVADDGEEHAAQYQGKDDAGDPEHRIREFVDAPCRRPLRIERVERGVLDARSEAEAEAGQQRESEGSS